MTTHSLTALGKNARAADARKRPLLDAIEEAFLAADWNVSRIGTRQTHPLLLRVAPPDGTPRVVAAYVWNVTGGGNTRNPEERRVQITADFVLLEPSQGLTLLLGWDSARDVFVAFDAALHVEQGVSPSVQVLDSTLARAQSEQVAFQKKDNGETAVAFKSELLAAYVGDARAWHHVARANVARLVEQIATASAADGKTLGPLAQKIVATASTQARRRELVTMLKAVRSAGFARRVLSAYEHRCAVCGVGLRLLDAAHIVSVENDGSDETANGLALCALHHRAYDHRLIAVLPDYRVAVSHRRMTDLHAKSRAHGREDFEQLLLSRIRLPSEPKERPQPTTLARANQLRGWLP